MLNLTKYRNIMFDLDGTLIDTVDGHAQAFVEAFRKNGVGENITVEAIRPMIGMSGSVILDHLFDEKTLAEKGEQIKTDKEEIFKERYLEQYKIYEGIQELFSLLKEAGVKSAICSACKKDMLDFYLDALNIKAFLVGSTCSADTPGGKPDPIAVEVCCEKFGFNPQETLMIGDTPYDVIAAFQYEVDAICISEGSVFQEQDLLKTGALAVFKNIREFTEEFSRQTGKIPSSSGSGASR